MPGSARATTSRAPYRVERFGPGPILAGNASTYYVLFDQDRVCAEAMLSGWMSPFVDPAVRALAMLEQASRARSRRRLRRDPVHDLCRRRLAAAGRQDRPAELRHHPDRVRLPAGARTSWRRPPRRASCRSRSSGRGSPCRPPEPSAPPRRRGSGSRDRGSDGAARHAPGPGRATASRPRPGSARTRRR